MRNCNSVWLSARAGMVEGHGPLYFPDFTSCTARCINLRTPSGFSDQLSNSAGVVVKDLDDGNSRSHAQNDGDDDADSDK